MALQDVAQRMTAGQAPPVQLDKKSKHDRKNRRLAKESGLHPDEVDTNPRAIQEELALRYPDDEDTEEQDQEAPGLAEVAAGLQGKFIWTLPGGLLEYSTLFKRWADYKTALLKYVPKPKHNAFGVLSAELDGIDREGDADAIADEYADILDRVRDLIDNAGDTENFINLGDQFEPWLRTGKEPQHLNCWEATLFACEKAGKLSRDTMYAYYKDSKGKSSEHVFREFVLKRSMEMILDSDEEEKIPEHQDVGNAVNGDILCFWEDGTISHVAIYLGGGKCMSIWAEDTMMFATTTFTKLAANYEDNLHLEIVKF